MHGNAVSLREPKVHLKRLIDHFLLEKEVQPASSRCSFYRTIEEQATDKEAQPSTLVISEKKRAESNAYN